MSLVIRFIIPSVVLVALMEPALQAAASQQRPYAATVRAKNKAWSRPNVTGCGEYFLLQPKRYPSPLKYDDGNHRPVFAVTFGSSLNILIKRAETPTDPNPNLKYEIGAVPEDYIIFASMTPDGKKQRLFDNAFLQYVSFSKNDVSAETFDEKGQLIAETPVGPPQTGIRQFAYIVPPQGKLLSSVAIRAKDSVVMSICFHDTQRSVPRLALRRLR